MEVNNQTDLLNLLNQSTATTATNTDTSNDSNLQDIGSFSDLLAYLKNDPQYKDIVEQLEPQANSSQKYSSKPVAGWDKLNLQSDAAIDWTGLQAVYTNSQQFYSLMDTLFSQQESQNSSNGSSVDQIDFSTLLDNSYGPTTSLAAALQQKK